MDQALLDNLLIAVASLLVTVLATPVVKRIAHAVGAVKVPGDRHIHSTPTPELGGLAMLGGLMGAYALANGLGTFDELFRFAVDAKRAGVGALMLVEIQKTAECPGSWYGGLQLYAPNPNSSHLVRLSKWANRSLPQV